MSFYNRCCKLQWMKFLKIAFLSLFISNNFYLTGQTYVHTDSCCGNSISFEKIDDSTYRVRQVYEKVILFEGAMVHPVFNNFIDIDKNGEILNLPKYHFAGKCILRSENGDIKREFTMENRKIIHDKFFDLGRLYKEVNVEIEGIRTKLYHMDGKLSSETFESIDGSYSLKTAVDSKGRQTVFKALNGRDFVPINYIYKVYDEQDNLYHVFEYDSVTRKKHMERFYSNEKPESLVVYDKIGNYKTQMQFNEAGDTIFWTDKNTYVDNNLDTIYLYEMSLKPAIRYNYQYYFYNKSNNFKLINGDVEYLGIRNNNSYTISKTQTGSGRLISVIVVKGKHSYLTEYDSSGIVTRKKHWHTFESDVFSELSGYLDMSTFYQFILKLNQEIFIRGDNYYSIKNSTNEWYQDSFFSNNQLIKLNIYKNDTFYSYKINNGEHTLQFRSNYLYVFYDHVNCYQILKSSDNLWKTNEAFESIEKITLNKDEIYFYASKGGYACLFDWKGQRVIPLTYGLYKPVIQSGMYFYDPEYRYRYNSQERILMIVNDSKKKVYQLIDIKGNKILSSKYPLSYGNSDNYIQFSGFTIQNPNGTIGFNNLHGVEFSPIYRKIESIYYDKWLLTTDTGLYLVNEKGHAISNSFQRYKILLGKDSLLIAINQDSTFKVYRLKDMQVVEGLDKYKLFDSYSLNLQILNPSTKLVGKLDNNMEIYIPAKYEHITCLDNIYLWCKSKDTLDIYHVKDGLINRIIIDSIYNVQKNMPSKFINLEWKDHGIAYQLKNSYLVRKDSLYGIIGENGQWIAPIKYKELLITIQNQFAYLKNDKVHLIRPLNIREDLFDSTLHGRAALFYLAGSNSNLLSDEDGQVIAKNIDNINIHYIYRTNSISIKRNGSYLGNINTKGHWLIKNDSFEEVIQNGVHYFIKDKKGMAGLMNNKSKILIQPEHKYIAYDSKYEMYWHSLFPKDRNPQEHSDLYNLWQVKHMKDGKTLNDTFRTPLAFYNGYLIIMNNRNLLGVLDSSLNYVLPFKYKSVDYIDNNNSILAFKTNDSKIEIYDKKFKWINTLLVDQISPLNNKHYLAYTKTCAYYLDSNFNLLDSSTSLFHSRKSYLYKSEFNDEMKKVSNFEFSEENQSSDYYLDLEEEEEDTLIIPAEIYNIITTVRSMSLEQSSPYYADLNIPFQPQYIYSNYHSRFNVLPELFNLPLYNSFEFGKTMTINYYRQIDLNISENNYYPNNYYHSFISFKCNPKNGYSYDETSYLNLYIGDSMGLIQVKLEELIPEKAKSEFNKIFFEELNKIQDEEIPCMPANDPYKYYQNSFYLSDKGLTIFIDYQYSVTIPYERLNKLMSQVWQLRLTE